MRPLLEMVPFPFYNARMNSLSSTSRDFETIAVVGVGLIGGSIAAALKQRGYSGNIIGVGRNAQRLAGAKSRGLIDTASLDLSASAAQADLIVFCTPVDLIVAGVLAAAQDARPGILMTDAGSVKGSICRGLAGSLPEGVTFIGSHPLAGSEQSGYENADGHLFEGRVCVVTSDEATPADQLSRLKNFWQSMGSAVVELSAADHDRGLAQTSHLPHLVASVLAAAVSAENHRLAASGFCDTTRIAAGDPDLWTAILLANGDELLGSLAVFDENLRDFRAAIANRDAEGLKKLLQVAKTARESFDRQE